MGYLTVAVSICYTNNQIFFFYNFTNFIKD